MLPRRCDRYDKLGEAEGSLCLAFRRTESPSPQQQVVIASLERDERSVGGVGSREAVVAVESFMVSWVMELGAAVW
jgi:hypothetical protein